MNSKTLFDIGKVILLPIAHLFAGLIITLCAMPAIIFVIFFIKLLDRYNLAEMVYVFLSMFTITISYFVFGYTLMLLISIIRIIFRINSEEENLTRNSLKLFGFAAHHGLIWLVSNIFLPFVKNTFLINMFFRGMGAKIGNNTFINTTKISDCNLIEIGSNCMIGGDVVINGHSAEGTTKKSSYW